VEQGEPWKHSKRLKNLSSKQNITMKTHRNPKAQERLWQMVAAAQQSGERADLSTAIHHIRGLIQCLTQHISDEAKSHGVTLNELCPCSTNEIAKAEKFIKSLQISASEH
jgi:hypothetical protein